MTQTQGAQDLSVSTSQAPDPRPLAVLAVETLVRVVRQVPDPAWDRSTAPHVTTMDPSRDRTLREILSYHAYDDAWIPDMLAGRTMAEAGEDVHGADPFDRDRLGEDPAGRFAEIAATGVAAIRDLDDLTRTVHCSFGDFSAGDYLWQVVTFRALRAVEIARLVGADDRLPAELVAGMLAYFEVHAEQWRQWGVFGPAVEAPADADPQERLLALTGRAPR
ncbi:uncharacterized protein (TIGR03086 family) [Kineococcus xinjiangensis]|uniref:Uncharacterized protein (TIGR03086 family) n=1 Tax=Kineococcus xinjiangensis TaxID=512762 RepID=A0A2S6ID47_9ACTN|nr:hypothetical protein [Kineococcus xinjiangensis]PPK92090.1 uncharacterized protein (TIGR03086 family) [Kineococcus xinjiangensis]